MLPWPGKCFADGMTPSFAKADAIAPESLDTSSGEEPKARTPMTGLKGLLFTSATGAKFRLMPQNARMRFYLSKLFATAVVTIWSFFMNYFFTFA